MKKCLKLFVSASALGVCLAFFLISQGPCQSSPQVEVLFAPEQGQEIFHRLTTAIQTADKRIYILIYSFTLDELAENVVAKHREGVDVRVIMDKRQANVKGAVTEILQGATVPLLVKTGSKGGLMHIKALIADDVLFTGSYNYSQNATFRSDENFLIIRDKDIVSTHLAKFNQLWEQAQW